MPAEDDDLQAITPEDLLLRPAFSLPIDESIVEPTEKPSGPDEVSQFDQRYREPFTGLIYLGALKEEVKLLGHTFSLETPTQEERLESGVLHKRFLNSISSEIGWAAISVAAYLHKVDGNPLPEAITIGASNLTERFNWVVQNLRGPVIAKVFEKCLVLESQVDSCIDELERLGGS